MMGLEFIWAWVYFYWFSQARQDKCTPQDCINEWLFEKYDPLASCCSNQSQIQIFIPACVGIFDYNSSAFGQIKKSLNG